MLTAADNEWLIVTPATVASKSGDKTTNGHDQAYLLKGVAGITLWHLTIMYAMIYANICTALIIMNTVNVGEALHLTLCTYICTIH